MINHPIPLREAARMLGLGPNKVFKALRKDGVLDKNNVPFRQYVTRGYFEVSIRSFEHKTVGERLYAVTEVTPAGLRWLNQRFDESQKQELAS